MGKFVVPKGSLGNTKEWEEGAPRTCYANADQSRIQEKQGQIGAQRGVPRVSLLPSLLPFILSITPSAPANQQQVPTPLLHGSRVHRAAFCCRCQCTGTLYAWGEVFAFRKIQRILLPRPRVRISAPESLFREVSKEMKYIIDFTRYKNRILIFVLNIETHVFMISDFHLSNYSYIMYYFNCVIYEYSFVWLALKISSVLYWW